MLRWLSSDNQPHIAFAAPGRCGRWRGQAARSDRRSSRKRRRAAAAVTTGPILAARANSRPPPLDRPARAMMRVAPILDGAYKSRMLWRRSSPWPADSSSDISSTYRSVIAVRRRRRRDVRRPSVTLRAPRGSHPRSGMIVGQAGRSSGRDRTGTPHFAGCHEPHAMPSCSPASHRRPTTADRPGGSNPR